MGPVYMYYYNHIRFYRELSYGGSIMYALRLSDNLLYRLNIGKVVTVTPIDHIGEDDVIISKCVLLDNTDVPLARSIISTIGERVLFEINNEMYILDGTDDHLTYVLNGSRVLTTKCVHLTARIIVLPVCEDNSLSQISDC